MPPTAVLGGHQAAAFAGMTTLAALSAAQALSPTATVTPTTVFPDPSPALTATEAAGETVSPTDGGQVTATATPTLAMMPVPPPGRTFYVDSVHGSDSNSGTSPGSPWETLAGVNNMTLGPGDTVNLARGSTWTGAGGDSAALLVQGAGEAGYPITIQAYGTGPAPILRNPSSGPSRALRVLAPWVVVQGLLLRDATAAGIALATGADHAVLRDNEAAYVGTGIVVDSQYDLIISNYVHDITLSVNTPAGSYGDAVLLHASNNEVSYNTFIDIKAPSLAYGVDGKVVEFYGTIDHTLIDHNYSDNSAGFDEVGGGAVTNVVVAYNVIVNPGPVEGFHFQGPFVATIGNYQFVSNTVVGLDGPYSVFFFDGELADPAAFVVRNNIFYLQGFQVLLQGTSPFTHDHNLYYFLGTPPQLNFPLASTEAIADPLFVDPAAGNYQLQAGSPAIGAGLAPPAFPTDFGGRPTAGSGGMLDLGAFEYTSQAK